MHDFDLDNAINLIQHEIDDHSLADSLWAQHVATQNENFHTHALNRDDNHEVIYEHIPIDKSEETLGHSDDLDFFDDPVDWVIASAPKFASAVASVVVGEEIGELLDSDVAKFAGHYATGKIIDFVSDSHTD